MSTLERWLLPDGIEEVLPRQAAKVERSRRQVLDLFAGWGYEFVVTPHIEFLDSLLTGVGQELALRTFSVTDPLSGQLMGFRADITPQVARMDAHSLHREGPNRLCYAGSVVHARPRALTTSRSPIQLGAELYGDASPAADIEIISLMLETLQQSNIDNVHLDLGHVGVFRGLAKAANLSEADEGRLFAALQRKAVTDVAELTAGLSRELADMLKALCGLCGGPEVLERARTLLLSAPRAVREALEQLQYLADILGERYPHIPVYFDLSELRGYNYHTGVVFAAFVPGVGQSIAQGGRYDDIGAVFGRSRPATGFSTDLKTLVSLGGDDEPAEPAAIWAPADSEAALWQAVCQLRQQGERVIQALPGQVLADAAAAGCNRHLTQIDGQWLIQQI